MPGDESLERIRARARRAGIKDSDLMSDRELRCWQANADADRLVLPPGQPMPNARLFVEDRYGHDERPLLAYQGGQFYRWDGACWPSIDDQTLRSEVYTFFEDAHYLEERGDSMLRKPFAPTMRKTADTMDALRAVTIISPQTVPPAWMGSAGAAPADELIACQNGLVHWPTRKLHPHTPSYWTHHAVPFEFDAGAANPERWLRFLNDLWGDDEESKLALQELMGYLISGDTRYQKMFLIWGQKRSGKGTIARVIRAMLGEHNVANPTLSSLATNFGLSPLIGKPVAIISDARLGSRSDGSIVTERMLSISGEDALTVDRKHIDPWTGKLSARIVVLTNELPRITDSSGALASRFVILTTMQSFYGRENPDLFAELVTELPAIFNWSLDGLESLRRRGRFIQPEASTQHVRELEDLGSPVGAFVRDECEMGADRTIGVDELFAGWRDWCESSGHRPGSAQIFGRNLRAAFPAIRVGRPRSADGGRYREYQGIELVRSGPRSEALQYPQFSPAEREQRNAPDRGPSRTTSPGDDERRVEL